jgi:hypothetical protein
VRGDEYLLIAVFFVGLWSVFIVQKASPAVW